MNSTDAIQLVRDAEESIRIRYREVEDIAKHNQLRVLKAFWRARVSETDLHGSTGYGLGDVGREKLEQIYADVFGTQAALVRPQIISGTHALRLGLFGVVRPGDEILFATGAPYDTLEAVVGIRPAVGSLAEWGVTHHIVPLRESGEIDIDAILERIKPNTRVVMFQKSRGYSARKALPSLEMSHAFRTIRERHPRVILAVDNCYGEFVERTEPTEVGADLAMGSLIKNPGAGIATTGGYIVGRADLIEMVAAQLTAPGVGAEAGPTHDFLRSMFQSFFLAPHIVSQAVKGSILASRVLETLGIVVSPTWDEPRVDLIVSAFFGSPERLLAFCRAVQSCAPIDSFVRPDAAPMAGYESEVVMAAGAFVQGGSLEMSADAPMREPYIGYFQGGLTYEHVYIAMERIAETLMSSSK